MAWLMSFGMHDNERMTVHQLFEVVPRGLENSWINTAPRIFRCCTAIKTNIITSSSSSSSSLSSSSSSSAAAAVAKTTMQDVVALTLTMADYKSGLTVNASGFVVKIWLCSMSDDSVVGKFGCWWFDWSFACLIAPVVTTTSMILRSNKIQNGDILAPANQRPPGKMAIKLERERERQTERESLFSESDNSFLVL